MAFEVTGCSGLLTRNEIAAILTALAHSVHMRHQADRAVRDLDYLRGYFNALQNIGEAVGVAWTGGSGRLRLNDDALEIHNVLASSRAIIHVGSEPAATTDS